MKKLYLNGNEIKKLYFNNLEIKKGYFNNNLIFEDQTPECYWEYKASSDTTWTKEEYNTPAELEARIPSIKTIYPTTLYDINIKVTNME